ncbi:MAG: pyridoxal-dependent decarboxylase [Candidatus Riflebacteria bacterium]|nr:pyridoxal-dependent decarboxylase [Candidatus Riflebacteria bacterium]
MININTENLQTPCYVFDRIELEKNFSDFHNALKNNWSNYIFSYSVKTNSLPWIVTFARSKGCYAEVVSDAEYALAMRLGYSPEKIVFNGPVKGREMFLFALEKGSIVNIDSNRELDWVEEYSKKCNSVSVGLRVNIDLEKYCPGETVTGKAGGRFGFSYENGTLKRVVDRLEKCGNIKISGLHMHVTTLSRSNKVFENLARFSVKIAEEYHLKLEYVDIGGGFFGGGSNVGAYDDYIKTIAKEFKKSFDADNTSLIIEPGGAVVCTPGYYIARVIDVRETTVDRFVVTEASRINIDHEMKKTRYVYSTVTENKNLLPRQVICGYTCMESDRLFVMENDRQLEPGDVIIFHNAGAYSLCFSPVMFIDFPPVVYIRENDGRNTLVREKWTVNEYLQKTLF